MKSESLGQVYHTPVVRAFLAAKDRDPSSFFTGKEGFTVWMFMDLELKLKYLMRSR